MNKDLYRKLCDTETDIPLFSRDWWLDAVCGSDGWNVSVVASGDQIRAALPYAIKRFLWMRLLHMPPLTQTLGPLLRLSDAKYAKQLAHQKDLMQQLIAQLPSYTAYKQNWHHSVHNWLPFYWNGFEQTTRYTYLLDLRASEEELWDGMLDNIRRDIRKAEKRFGLTVTDNFRIDEYLVVNHKTFERQGSTQPYSDELVRCIDKKCIERGCRKIWAARDEQGRVHAAVYVVWDRSSAYYLMGGSDPALRNSGATSLCLWRAICHARQVTSCFDFEGSMIESVERYFRAFGAKQIPYFHISKRNSRILSILDAIKAIKSVFIG
jgi:hypothetical protein